MAILIQFNIDPVQSRNDANRYALIFSLLGLAAFVLCLLQQTIFTIIGEETTENVRNETYSKILKMPMTWFDRPKNNAGSLSARLQSDCHCLNGLTTTYISVLIQSTATVIAGIVISLVYEWRTALVAMALLPLMIVSGAIQMTFNTGFSAKTGIAYNDSANLITESMVNIRTVASLDSEEIILNRYALRLERPYEMGVRNGNVAGFLFGASQLIMYV